MKGIGRQGDKPSQASEWTRAQLLAGAMAIVGLVWWIYWPAIHGSWLWDDGYEVADNPILRDPAGLGKIWLGQGALDYFPLKATVQWLLWRMLGEGPTGWHVCSIVLHSVNSLLVWRLLHRLGLRHAWLGGLLFAVHPLAVESVAWIAEFKNVLSLPLALMAFLAFLNYDEHGRSGSLVWAAGWFLAAMLCKSTVVMLPCVLLLFLWWKHPAFPWRRLWSLVPFFAIALLLGLVTIWFQHQRAIGGAEVPVGGVATRIARAGLALGFYAWKAVWPVELMPVYPRWPVNPPAVHQFLIWPVLAAVVLSLWRNRAGIGRHVLFGLGAFALSLVPILGFLAMAYMHAGWVSDHFAYVALPAVGGLFAAGAGAALARLAAGMRIFARSAMVGVVLLLVVFSRDYAAKFRSPAELWTHAVELNPDSPVAQNNLGNAYFAAQLPGRAAFHFAAAVRLEPANTGARINLGNALAQIGRLDDAIRQHEAAVASAPGSAATLNSLGGTLLEAGRLAEARRYLEAAIRAKPDAAEAHNNLAIVLARTGVPAEAKVHFETALRLNPALQSARANLLLLERNTRAPPKEQPAVRP